jgi:hypothetical protein
VDELLLASLTIQQLNHFILRSLSMFNFLDICVLFTVYLCINGWILCSCVSGIVMMWYDCRFYRPRFAHIEVFQIAIFSLTIWKQHMSLLALHSRNTNIVWDSYHVWDVWHARFLITGYEK